MRSTPAMLVVADASILVKLGVEDEEERPQTEALVRAHAAGTIELCMLDLTLYEVGNALQRRTDLPAASIARFVSRIRSLGSLIAPDDRDFAAAADLVRRHGLTFYDATYGAVAGRRGAALATADAELIAAGLGESAGAVAARL